MVYLVLKNILEIMTVPKKHTFEAHFVSVCSISVIKAHQHRASDK